MRSRRAVTGFWLVVAWAFLTQVAAQSASSANQTPTWQTPTRQTIERLLMDLQYEAAKVHAERYEPRPQVRAFYVAHAAFLRAAIEQSTASFAELETQSSWAIALIEQREQTPYSEAFIAELHTEQALANGLQRASLATVSSLRKALKHLKRSQKNHPANPLAGRVMGLGQLGISSIPANYQWVVDVLGLSGDYHLGKSLVRRSAQQGVFLAGESRLLLYFVAQTLEDDALAAYFQLDTLLQQYPEAILPRYFFATNALARGETPAAIAMLESVLRQEPNNQCARMPQVHHLYGKALLFSGRYLQAANQFTVYIKLKDSGLHLEDAKLKRAMALALTGQRVTAIQLLKELLDETREHFDEDAYAVSEARYYVANGFDSTELALQRARFAYDGGFWDRCHTQLDELSVRLRWLTPEQRCHLYYRYGRLFQAQGKPVKAKSYFKLCAKQKVERHKWMQAYAHYYTGQLFEAETDWHAARYHYREALGYQDIPYQNSLEQRAKAGLARLKDAVYTQSVSGDTLLPEEANPNR